MKPIMNLLWLDRTVAKDLRPTNSRPLYVMMHGTGSPNHLRAKGTLDYNLTGHRNSEGKLVYSSYNYLIGYDGTIYHYVNEKVWVAFGAGNGMSNVKPGVYRDYEQNVYAINVEIDIPNRPSVIANDAQYNAMVDLAIYFDLEYGIPLNEGYYIDHKDTALPRGRKTDPIGFSSIKMLSMARIKKGIEVTPTIPFGTHPVDERFREAWYLSGGVWKANELTPGYAKTPAKQLAGGVWLQVFERGVARWVGGTVNWLLLSEAIQIYGSDINL